MKKRIVSLLLALVMMTSLLPVQVFAVDTDDAAEQSVVEQQQEEKQVEQKQEEAPEQEPAKEEPAKAEEPVRQEPVAAEQADTPAPLADDGKTFETGNTDGMKSFTLSQAPVSIEGPTKVETDPLMVVLPKKEMAYGADYEYVITMPAGTESVTLTYELVNSENTSVTSGFFMENEGSKLLFANLSKDSVPSDSVTSTTVTLTDGEGVTPFILSYLYRAIREYYCVTVNQELFPAYRFRFVKEQNIASFTQDLTEYAAYKVGETAVPLTVAVNAPEDSTITYAWYSGASEATANQAIDGADKASYTPDTSKVGVTYYRVKATVTTAAGESVTITSKTAKVAVKSADVAFTVQTYANREVTAVPGSQTVFRIALGNWNLGKILYTVTGTIPDGVTIDRIWSGSPADSYDLTKANVVSIDYDTNTFTLNLNNAVSEADAEWMKMAPDSAPQSHNLGRCLYLQTSDGTVYTLILDSSSGKFVTAPTTVQLVDENQYVLNDFRVTTLRSASTSVVSGTLRSETPVILRAQSFGSGTSLTGEMVKDIIGSAGYWDEAQESWVLVNGQQVGGTCYGGTEEHPAESSAFTLQPGLNVVEVYTNTRLYSVARTRAAKAPGLGDVESGRTLGNNSKIYSYSPIMRTSCVVYLIDYQGTSAENVPQDDATNTALRDVVPLRFGTDSKKVEACPFVLQEDGTYLLTLPKFYHTNKVDDTNYTHAVLINAKPETPGAAAVINSSTQGLVLGKSLVNSAFLDIEALYGVTDPSFTITVTAADGTTKQDYTVKVAYANSETAPEIAISGPTLDTAFDKDTYTYYLDYASAAAANGTMQITLPEGATATVNGAAYTAGATVTLDPKQDFYRVTVTAEDGVSIVSYYFVTRYADGTIPYASISDKSKALAKEMLSGWYKALEDSSYFANYWSIFMTMATGNADGSEYDFTGAYVKDPARHGMTQATDWAACIMEIVMLGRNPYDFPRYVNGKYEEHFDYVQGLIDRGGGAWGNNVWYHMAAKAAGAKGMLGGMKSAAVDATGNLDIRGWSIASLENCVETKDMVRYVDSLHNVQDTSGKYTSLWTDQSWHGGSSGNAYTIGCVLSAIAAGGGDPEKLFAYAGHTPLQTIRDVMYNAETGKFQSADGSPEGLAKDMVIGLGDILHGSNVWARYTLTEQKYNDLIAKAKANGVSTEGMPAYKAEDTTVGKAYYGLYDAVATALEAKGDYSMRPQVTFGMPYELFIDAVNAMPSANALTTDDLADLEALIKQYEAMDDASREAVVSVNAAAMTKYQALVAAGLKLKGSDNAAKLYEQIMALPEAKDVTDANSEQVKADVDAIRKAMSDADKKLLAWAGASVLAKLEAVADAAGAPKPSITVTFQLLGDEKHSGNDADIHTYRFNEDELEEWIETVTVTVPEGSTVGDVFRKVLGEKNMSSSGADNGYVSVINDLAAQTNTTFSGWMYLVNGKHPQVGLNQYVLKDKDAIVWHWTDDYQLEDDEVYHNAGRVKKYIENLIALIGEVDTSTACKARIDKARAAYDKLTDAEKNTIKTTQTLVDAEAKYKSLTDMDALVSLIEEQTWTVSMNDANDAAAVKAWLEAKLNALNLNGAKATATVTDLTAATAGTADNKGGTAGSFTFDVTLTVGEGGAQASRSLTGLTGTITATAYVKSANAGVTAIKVAGVDAKILGNSFTVTVPYGTKITAESFKITLADSKASITTLPHEENGVWSFTVTAEDGTAVTYTVTVTVGKSPEQTKVDTVIDLINGIGTVDKNSKDKIEAARKAYNALSEEQKALVPASVLQTLTDAEAAYAKLTGGTTPGGNTGKPGNTGSKPSTGSDAKKDDGKTVKSGNTGDAGVTLYVGMGLVAVMAGAVVITRKRKEN